MENKEKSAVFTVPNILSLFRLMLIPIFVSLYFRRHLPVHGCMILLISGFTDILDGYIARRFDMTSDLGKILDPVADKLTQAVTLFCLTEKHPLMMLPLFIMLIKESLCAALCFLAIKKSGQVQSSDWHGKLNTAVLYAIFVVHLIWADIPNAFSFSLILISCIIMLFSFALYFLANISVLIGAKKTR